jgi:hypothetical protein
MMQSQLEIHKPGLASYMYGPFQPRVAGGEGYLTIGFLAAA